MNNRSTVGNLAYIAVFAALIIVFAFVAIPVGSAGVPIVIQNAVVILTGLVLGPKRALLTVALVYLLGLALPVMAGGRTLLAALAGPTIGYLVGYLVSAVVAGLIAYQAPARRRAAQIGWFILAGVTALALQYVCGAFGLMFRAEMAFGPAFAAQLPFILPDAAKVAVMILIALGVHAAFPDLLSRHGRRRVS
ncbi:biotin transporter BioY [Corynebacterium yudongzhengii]|uniref:Biotin transporter n=1 Tax=Corynebacterium yudongzhengii TaxID=2080740 RepID=A0A2U1T5E5_9CORY|nr:biotin transporter BioY [Corynebacterium yudongzhengii]AWB81742.1 biotin transporter BioY [Corynebacterium yudongzhengii]PWC01175.1 biotin transporter BioY [Corynebacterium yudongzhengii]